MMRNITIIILFLLSLSSIAKDEFAAKSFERPLREISVIATDEGFYPKRISAFKGESIRFFVTSSSSKKNCFLLQNHKVFLAAEKGEVNEGFVHLEKAGKFKYYCPANKMQGTLTVLEEVKPIEEEKQIEELRKPASVTPGYWMPRDYDEE